MKLFMKHCGLLFMAAIVISAITGCADNDEPDSVPDEGREPSELASFSSDLLNGGLVYVIDCTEAEGFDIPLKTNKPVEFTICDDSPFTIEKVTEEDGEHLVGHHIGAFSEKAHIMVVRADNLENPEEYRHFIAVVINRDMVVNKATRSNSSNMTSAYGDFMGMGTQCFQMVGNTTRSILQSSLIPIDDQNLVTSQVLDLTDMFEVSGESFHSSMTSWAANVGLSISKSKGEGDLKKTYSGCLNFGINGSVNTSEDFEYYMNIYKVVRGEMAYNMKEFENMAADSLENKAFLSFVAKGFLRDILHVENAEFDTEEFFTTWGTDMISQAQLGGFKVYLCGRETNIYENSIGFDASLELKKTNPNKVDGSHTWFDIYSLKNSPHVGVSTGGSYQNDDYFASSKTMKYSKAFGGNPSFEEEPDKWIAGFEEMDNNVKWQPISYRRNSDTSKDVWGLYPIEKMASNVINAVENRLQLLKLELSKDDSVMLRNARANVASITNAKFDYIERHLTYPKEATRLVLCDVMMKYDEQCEASGKPEPFVAPDPRDASKLRTYYPMMANKFFDKKQKTEHRRGHAINTNIGCFKSGIGKGSHYWYYALAHEDDCQGIVDITFYDHLEDFFSYRGDPASKCSGLANYPKYVCVKYYDPGKYTSADKITAFGIFDDHKQVNNIIASTGGSELALEATESEYNNWVNFWKGAKDHHKWPKYAFYHGGGAIPHGIYVKYTTKTLPIERIKNVTHPKKY